MLRFIIAIELSIGILLKYYFTIFDLETCIIILLYYMYSVTSRGQRLVHVLIYIIYNKYNDIISYNYYIGVRITSLKRLYTLSGVIWYIIIIIIYAHKLR